MPLKIHLKPGEHLFIGGAAVVNGRTAAELTLLNDVPLLRDKDIMRERDANTPARRIYLAVQLMYMDPANLLKYADIFQTLAGEFIDAAPSAQMLIHEIDVKIAEKKYYDALKTCRDLVSHEDMCMPRRQV